jgi:hypothetical protein
MEEKNFSDLFNAQVTLYERIKCDETVYDSWIYCVNVFKEKLKIAEEQSVIA